MEKIGVIGAGSWGTALAILLNENGNDVTLWSHRETEAEHMRQTRECSKLSGIKIPEAVEITSDLKRAASGKKVAELCARECTRLQGQACRFQFASSNSSLSSEGSIEP